MADKQLLFGMGLAALLAAVIVIDGRRMVIPNALNGALGAMGTGYGVLFLDRNLGAIAFECLLVLGFFLTISWFYVLLRGRSGFGMGDVKFLTAAAAWTGLQGIPWIVLLASLTGLIWALANDKVRDGAARIAFGPHLAVALMTVWLLEGTLTA
jgi:leader peptidase (prepilin peptidase) / N-methyltransferase